MNILQINVCLDKGGAAKVALDLHNNLLSLNVNSRFAYGWGERGGVSSSELSVKNCFRIGSKQQVIPNFVIHTILGVDLFNPFGIRKKNIIDAIKMADVIHLHVIHSYFIEFSWLVKAIKCAKKPVVWTTHDYWALTGRCASVGDCNKWKSGCGNCPKLKSYPPAYFDNTRVQFKRKRELLEEISSDLVLVAPSKFLASELAGELPNIEVFHIPNWLDKEFEIACRNKQLGNDIIKLPRNKVKVLIVANNLNDPLKVNVELIYKLLKIKGVELHCIGSNSPFLEGNVINHGEISNRTRMVEVVSLCDVALFTSKIDTFGLVMIEALACGVPVLAIESMASREVLLDLDIKPIGNFPDILKILGSRILPSEYGNKTQSSLRASVLDIFSREVSTKLYIEVYSRLVEV
jgi:putative colanic acid biosynthesis glycosyltransferase